MRKIRKRSARAIKRTRRKLTKLLQLDLFKDKTEIAEKALAEIKTLNTQLAN